jgi:hypothetical protein
LELDCVAETAADVEHSPAVEHVGSCGDLFFLF